MSVLLFSLRNVPSDEADEVRDLLVTNGLAFYETPAGRWGISAPALWLNNSDELSKARALIDAYQKSRSVKQRGEYEALKRAGRHKTVWRSFRENPIRVVVYLAVAALVLYFSIRPFFDLGN